MVSFLKKRYLSNKKVPCFNFVFYDAILFGSVIIVLAFPSFPHELIIYLINYEIIFLHIWLCNYYYLIYHKERVAPKGQSVHKDASLQIQYTTIRSTKQNDL